MVRINLFEHHVRGSQEECIRKQGMVKRRSPVGALASAALFHYSLKHMENDKPKRKYSKDGSIHVTDEVINTITHMSGAIFALLGTVLLVVFASVAGKTWHIISFSIYGLSLFLVFLASAFHHGLDGSERVNNFFRIFDYLVIFGLIAGTYTPLALVLTRDAWGWSIFGAVWAVAAAGIAVKASIPKVPKWFTNTFYVCLGWMGVFLIFRILPVVGWQGVSLILIGGVVYTVGAFIFYFERPNPVPGKFGFHEIWHLFVLTGAAIHYLFMYYYILPF